MSGMHQVFVEQWQETADAWEARLQAVGDQGTSQTPCQEWDVQELVDHAVGVQRRLATGMLGAELAEDAEWPAVRAGVEAALADPSVLEGEVPEGPFGPMPKSMMMGIGTSDLLIHTWDLARAIGADEVLPAGPVASAYMGLQRMPEEPLRASGAFGASVECADDADEQTKLLSYTGRQV